MVRDKVREPLWVLELRNVVAARDGVKILRNQVINKSCTLGSEAIRKHRGMHTRIHIDAQIQLNIYACTHACTPACMIRIHSHFPVQFPQTPNICNAPKFEHVVPIRSEGLPRSCQARRKKICLVNNTLSLLQGLLHSPAQHLLTHYAGCQKGANLLGIDPFLRS